MAEAKSYRDALSTVSNDGKRVWLYPKKPKGWFTNKRRILAYVLLAVLFGLPWINYNGEPLVMLNVVKRHFIIFGLHFTPQDMHLLALAAISLVIFIILFTVVFGRIFCGWVCPQTIFMEMVYRPIEYWIEGDYNQQKKLNKAPWTAEKYMKKIAKHAIFFVIAVLIANTFLSYIITKDEVLKIIREPISMHLTGFIAMLVFSGMFYFVFAFFREQVCVAVCPYGRLQGVMLVKESIVVIYDWVRGEPRGKRKRNEEVSDKGDCVNCNLCVKVCPTGIDIRNGTQLECVNCTACMDACDEVMNKIGLPEGLIRYDSESGIEKGERKIFTTRVMGYTAVLAALLIFQGFLFVNRTSVETLVLRTPGMLYQKTDDGRISNLYNYQLINKTNDDIQDVQFKLNPAIGEIQAVGEVKDVVAQKVGEGSFFIKISPEKLDGRKNELTIEVYSNGELIDETTTNFLGPNK